MHTLRAQAVNGDLVELHHPTVELDGPFTSDVEVAFDGLHHQVLSTANRSLFNFAEVSGEFTIGDMAGHLIESIDTVATQAVHTYLAVLSTDGGVLSTRSYVSAESVVDLMAALRPTPSRRGAFADPDDTVQFVGPARVSITTDFGVLALSPLTTQVVRLLPDWSGSAVAHGELFSGRHSDNAAYLTLVTPTARCVLMVNGDPDDAVGFMADLRVDWHT